MMIANREIQGVMAVTEANLVTLTMETTVTAQPTFHPLHHHLQTTTAAINPLVAHLGLHVAVMREIIMAEAEVLHHLHLPYPLSPNHPKALRLFPNKAILPVMAVVETAGSKAMTITVARAVAMEAAEEEMMGMEVDIDEEMMMEDVVVGNREVTT